MKLSFLTQSCAPLWERCLSSSEAPGTDPDITSIHYRAQEVRPGGLFVAIKGMKADGHDFIDQARERGAAAVVIQDHLKTGLPTVTVPNTRRALSAISARFYDFPASQLTLVGISGTNGKTTTTWILEQILKAAGHETGVIGTINWRYKDQVHDTPVTTPESLDLQRMLSTMARAGVTHVVMEVSSHALDLDRVRDCHFNVAVFTNLTQDHLDYHKTLSAYWACKKKFYTRQLARGNKNGRAVINIDDPRGARLAPVLSPPAITTGRNAHAQITVTTLSEDLSGIKGVLDLNGAACPFSSPLTGAFNVENILSASGGAHALGISPHIICQGIENCHAVPGRLERIPDPAGGRFIFVDYAHTPDALESILKTLKQRTPQRLITVFGCGGDRDRSKRPIMGGIAGRYSDISLVTSDNPRSESPEAIIDDILTGMDTAAPSLPWETFLAHQNASKDIPLPPILVEPDRRKALEAALSISGRGDTIVAAGKGHETYQITAQGTIDFDDRKILSQGLCRIRPKREREAQS